MRNKLSLLLLLAFFMPFFALGQNVKIVGKTNRPNALIRLLSCDDQLTDWQTEIAETHADKDGNFSFEATINDITPVIIAVNLERADMIICPNANYNIDIDIAERRADVSYFEKDAPTLAFNTIDDGGFYAQYLAVEEYVNDFIYDNIYRIARERNLALLDTLDNQLNKNFGAIKSKYINDYVKYRKASVVMAVNVKKTISEYFDNQEVLYSLPAYMEVFQELFKNDFNDNDFLSRNQQLAELIKINKIKKRFFSNTCDKKTALKELEEIKKTTKYQKNKAVATNMAKVLDDMTYDSQAPDFSLKDKNGKMVQLSDYQNDMVLLQFVDHYSSLNDYEFSVLNELQKQWNDTIKVVTIATKESFKEYVQIFDNQGYKWTLLNLDDNILLLEKYHVMMCPTYVILKKKCRVGMAPAPSPDHNLDIHVRRISKYL